ncbi:MAG TPA: acyl-[ACP]--phospholipid O-acyltransferase [Candidatus Acidoferrum sp.]|nr:acyl-[ACP]--phospholipid O-acyltransferase [Candidatus Acidoferrum sp.]
MSQTRPESQMTGASSADRSGLRGFWALIITQFQGAFSDNALKQLALFIGISLGFGERQQDRLIMLSMALLTLPFIFFSMFGGSLATRFSKRSVTIAIKCFEIVVMLVATYALAHQALGLVLGCLFFMGLHSAIFGPSKYGSLPELLPEKKISWGNGVLELGTFLGIVLGMQAGGMLSVACEGAPGRAGLVLVGLAVCGLITSCAMTRVPAADPDRPLRFNFIGDLISQWRLIRQDRVLRLAVIGNTFLWFMAALLSSNLFAHGEFALHCDKSHINHLWIGLSIGIGLGSVAAGYLSGGKIEYGLVPLGLLGMTALSALLVRLGLGYTAVLWHLAAIGFFTGFFAVPVNAIMQHRPRKEDKAGVLAAGNLISSAGICLAAGTFYLLRMWPHDTRMIFLIAALLMLAALVYTVTLLPDALLRFLLWCATHSLYRIRIDGRDNIPEKGGALFVCNHVSWVDALLLIASTDRPIRFLMLKDIYEQPWVKPFARVLGIIPISSEQRPREMLQSLHAASEAIRNGDVACIFAEGQITRIGQLLPFQRGMERIMKGVDAPVVPVALDGVLGSLSSFKQGRFVWKLPPRIPYPVTVCFGRPLPPTATAFDARQAVQELLASAWQHRRNRMQPLSRQFVRTARRHPRRFAMADAQTPKVTFGRALVKTVFLARRLKKLWAGQDMVGIFLPPSVPGALVNQAALLAGKVPVNLNYTLSEQSLASCAQQCHLKSIVTSRAFLEKIKLGLPGEAVLLEDLAARPGRAEILAAWLAAKFLPVGWLERACGRERSVGLDDLATVIFSSGSTGEPKGVMLSHYNIGSNIAQLEQVFGLGKHDCILGILPFFHSFGFTGTLCLPATLGVGVAFHPNPLDSRAIGPLVKNHAVTFLLATPTFLQLYLRGCAPADFGSLRLVMTGAEKLPDRLAAAFEEHFGIRPMEGYGCTECAPVVAVNAPDFRSAGFHQVGVKRGKIGHPLPGVCVRVVDTDNPWAGVSMPLGQPGLLLVRGPNVMQGYLGQPQKTAEVLRDGWYLTGDVAALDEDGFLQITDRLSRFSKIGGEMVPHVKVEEKLHELAGATEQTFVVTGLPDEKKGERLVVLHKLADGPLQTCLEKLAQSDLPNLWKPRADQFFHVDAFPLLGTGKLDLRKLREMAQVKAAETPA